MTRLFPLPCLLAHEGFGAACARTVRAHEHAPEKIPSKLWAALLLLLWLASHASTSSAAELRIGSATGYPGDTVELTVSLQGDGETAFADFLIEHSRVAHYASPAATSVAPRATCRVEGSRFRVIWDGTPNTDLVQLCTLRLTIYTYEEPRSNPAISGAPQLCLDAAHEYHSCTFVNGHVDVIYEIERSFIAVLGDPPTAPTLQEVVDFDYADPGATPPLGFVDGVEVVEDFFIVADVTQVVQRFGYRPVVLEPGHIGDHKTAGGLFGIAEEFANIFGILRLHQIEQGFGVLVGETRQDLCGIVLWQCFQHVCQFVIAGAFNQLLAHKAVRFIQNFTGDFQR